ncbi:hypothetical protein EVAR_52760_1 [Eumeta japonica]|uniref:Uncharacterized protein n=1 Tax=Eumeta variegata TaxID=151549 RepID=A0A4C1XE67_EUMVA|nr:hypothetical protein EVAR_52760_1 [Eumeta japonica]
MAPRDARAGRPRPVPRASGSTFVWLAVSPANVSINFHNVDKNFAVFTRKRQSCLRWRNVVKVAPFRLHIGANSTPSQQLQLHEFYKYTDGRAISSHHPWMRVAVVQTHTHTRASALRRLNETAGAGTHFHRAIEGEGGDGGRRSRPCCSLKDIAAARSRQKRVLSANARCETPTDTAIVSCSNKALRLYLWTPTTPQKLIGPRPTCVLATWRRNCAQTSPIYEYAAS